MWNDEDNNPYGAFDRPDGHLSDSLHSRAVSPRKYTGLPLLPLRANDVGASNKVPSPAPYDRDVSSPSSPVSTLPPDYASRITDTDDEDDNDYRVPQPKTSGRQKGVYDSRIEQILYENPEMPILITDAGKNHEGGGGYIVYTIRTGVRNN